MRSVKSVPVQWMVTVGCLLLMLSGLSFLPPDASAQTPPNDNDIAGYRQLQSAAYRDDAQGVKRFADEGAPLEVRDDYGRTPVIIAAHRSSTNAMEALIGAGADIDATDRDGFSALMISLAKGDTALRDKVIALGADTDSPAGPREDTLLGVASREGDVDLVKGLIAAGSNLDHVNKEGDTPLLQAVKYGDGGPSYQQIVQLLIDAGVRKGMQDADGKRARQYARELGYAEILEIFRNS